MLFRSTKGKDAIFKDAIFEDGILEIAFMKYFKGVRVIRKPFGEIKSHTHCPALRNILFRSIIIKPPAWFVALKKKEILSMWC
jgi:hypothetical protein